MAILDKDGIKLYGLKRLLEEGEEADNLFEF